MRLRPQRHGPRALSSLGQAVGNTPLVRIRRIASDLPGVEIYAKLECFNPGGSVKDRPALSMIRDAIDKGRLTRDKVIIDSTSGNTGVAYAWIGAALGYRVALVMPQNVTAARKQITRAFGAEIVFSDAMEGSDGAIHLVRKLVAESPEKYFYPDQYSNEANPRAHALGTAAEIWEATSGRVTHFCAGIGTGGTIMGTARGLKAKNAAIRCIALEPEEALHGLEGLKHMPSSIVPAIYREEELDEKMSIPTDDGWDFAERLGKEEGLLMGHSSGAAMAGAYRIGRRLVERGEKGVVVTLFPDRADRYFEPARWDKKHLW